MPLTIGTPRHLRTGGRFPRTALAALVACGMLAVLAPAADAVTFSNTTPISIPGSGGSNAPATPYPSPITVSGLSGTVTDVNVTLHNYSHQFSGDTHVVLVPPGATAHNILLMSGAGGNQPTSNATITLDDASTTALPTNAAIASGTYKPTARATTGVFPAPGPGNNFCSPGILTTGTPSYVGGNCSLATALNGSDPNGVWRLYVIDIGDPDGGQIAGGWSLDITAGGPATTAQALSVTVNGSGTVRGLGVSCPTSCTKSYVSGQAVTLTATPGAFTAFGGWSGAGAGACANSAALSCTVTMDAAKSVTATFNPLPRTLSIGKVGSGFGTVTGSGINCGVDCEQTFPDTVSAELTATATAGSTFAGWIGCDAPDGNACTVNMTGHKNVTARFRQNPVYPLPPVYPPPPLTLPGCGPGRNVITLGSGNDVRNGTVGNDLIFAGAGNDIIDGLAGDDCLDLGPGNDRGQGGAGHDFVVGRLGNDTLTGSAGNDRLLADEGNDNLVGNEGNDLLLGGSGVDRLLGGFGNDVLSGQSGNDNLSGSRGRDRIDGGSGNDRISGGSSADRVLGGQGNDRIDGNSSNDILSGSSGRDRITGGSGRDRITGGSGGDSISARDRTRDVVNCGSGRDRVVADRVDRVFRNCERVRRR